MPETSRSATDPEHLDVLVVGAGLSGIGTACHLERSLPGLSYAVLESREVSGGTWDLFRYPGVRSDSDMFSLSYSFRPWTSPEAIADGASVLQYLRDTAQEYGVEARIRYGHEVVSASWAGERARWSVRIRLGAGAERVISCSYLILCTGYYDYQDPYRPPLPGQERFTGRLVHPQLWPEDLDWAGEDVVVIGSGATAVSLVPALAPAARSTVMLQRSPSYLISLPQRHSFSLPRLARFSPRLAGRLERLRAVSVTTTFWHLCRLAPSLAARWLLGRVRPLLPDDYPMEHFRPRYNPWDQRLCVVPDADLFTALRAGDAEVVTGEIETFTENGIRLTNGRLLPATLVVTATGLRVRLLGGVALDVDGTPVDPAEKVTYKGTLLTDVPNLAFLIGYDNASWTLKTELSARFVVRMLKHMRRHGYRTAVAQPPPSAERVPLLTLTSGYLTRAAQLVPSQGRRWPWRLYSSYGVDALLQRFSRVDAEGIEFTR
ncbi:NAD(P)/FAD-dependent oxidoreductase [Kineosporia rhizophila]|uniref:flavin-containing monooxygenase n=1 Tax=Kineosporia rhizophila TaxID=84633 RepID=UPI001E485923|nr:NAD(P)/FAD-dependent oxidoreductase [Kineosporia rhizophila]